MDKDIKRDKLIRSGAVTAVFLTFILIIPILTLLRMGLKHIPVSQYCENILGKYKLIGINTRISETLSGGEYMESNEVLLGKDGWLFYKVTTDGTPLYDYMGIDHFTGEEEEKAYALMDDASETVFYHRAVSGLGNIYDGEVRLAVLTVPNKEQVYSEYMPDTVEKISDISRLDRLTEYVQERNHKLVVMDRYDPPWTYTDVSDVFLNVHDKYPLYYKTDTHWTDVGAYLALTQVMGATAKKGQVIRGKSGFDDDEDIPPASILDEVTFTEEPGFVGDLTKISATQDRYADIRYVIDPDSIPKRYKTDKKLLIVGDSFGDAMQHVAKHCFKEVRFMDIREYSDVFEEELDSYEPDLVILECVERYLPRLTELNDGGR